jgi:hypothetical protein
MLLLSMMLLAAQDGDVVQTAIANSRALTRGDVPCERAGRADDEIVVCGLREADKYRVPFVSAGSTRDSVPARTAYLTTDFGKAPGGGGAFLKDCGAVGVSVTMGFDGQTMVKRELAH